MHTLIEASEALQNLRQTMYDYEQACIRQDNKVLTGLDDLITAAEECKQKFGEAKWYERLS